LWLGMSSACAILALHQSKIFKHFIVPSGLQAYHKTRKLKGEYMPIDYENRVLVRRNARLLSAEEFQEIMEKGKAQATQLPSMPFFPDF
jgi:hypothetical protein